MSERPGEFPSRKYTWKYEARGCNALSLAVLFIKKTNKQLCPFLERFPEFYLPALLLIVLALTTKKKKLFLIFKRPCFLNMYLEYTRYASNQ